MTRKEALSAALDKALEDYEKLPKSEEEAKAWATFKESMGPWKVSNVELTAVLKALAENDDPEKQPQLFMQYKAPLTALIITHKLLVLSHDQKHVGDVG